MKDFYSGKNVFVTGHTGFKGAWLCRALVSLGANVTGYALEATDSSLYAVSGLDGDMHSVIGDIRDFDALFAAFKQAKPDVVFHLAAQPIVRESYERPLYTYETNVVGTANLLEAVRTSAKKPISLLNITTDKVYRNNEWCWGYREDEYLDGFDPYSNSKSCSELVTATYARCFLSADGTAVSTARAGNVIGGGDHARDRIIPDCVRAAIEGRAIAVRNPYSVRPYQHVLEPIFAYMMIAERQSEDASLACCYNVGPNEADCATTARLADLFCAAWGDGARWENLSAGGPHEANFLRLDCAKLKTAMDWAPKWDIATAVMKTVEMEKALIAGKQAQDIMLEQIGEYQKA